MTAPHRVDDPTLPAGWDAVYDPNSGLRYYWNRRSNETTYDHPAESSKPPPPPGPPPTDGSRFFGDDSKSGYGVYRDEGEDVPDSMNPPEFSSGSKEAIRYREKTEITVQGTSVPDPIQSFEEARFPSDIMQQIKEAGFSEPTPIQAQAWPVVLQGRDLVGIAKTGSGKTLGYMLPGLLHVRNNFKNPNHGPQVLVLAPTRELANQIKDETHKFGTPSGISDTCLYGGAPRGPQLRELRKGVSVAIATPGRLNDYLEGGQISLGQVEYLVLDEADRMLDMGFEPQIQRIAQHIAKKRQTLFFSATWPKEVRKIAAQFVQSSPVHIFIGSSDTLVANKDIYQYVDVVQGTEKDDRLKQFLQNMGKRAKILIFCGTKRMCDQLAYTLKDFRATAIHGDKGQDQRDNVLRMFKQGRSSILCATDVAARGLDIPNVDAVVNYDFPGNIEDYIHRIGRTARAGAKGTSYSFFTPADSKHADSLVKIIRDAGQEPPDDLLQMCRGGGGRGGRGRGRGGGGRGPGQSTAPVPVPVQSSAPAKRGTSGC